MFGFVGYIVAALLLGVLCALHGISVAERLVIQLVPRLSLLFVVTITRRRPQIRRADHSRTSRVSRS